MANLAAVEGRMAYGHSRAVALSEAASARQEPDRLTQALFSDGIGRLTEVLQHGSLQMPGHEPWILLMVGMAHDNRRQEAVVAHITNSGEPALQAFVVPEQHLLFLHGYRSAISHPFAQVTRHSIFHRTLWKAAEGKDRLAPLLLAHPRIQHVMTRVTETSLALMHDTYPLVVHAGPQQYELPFLHAARALHPARSITLPLLLS